MSKNNEFINKEFLNICIREFEKARSIYTYLSCDTFSFIICDYIRSELIKNSSALVCNDLYWHPKED